VTEQRPDERLQLALLKVPPAPPLLQETVPVGDVGVADESVTVAVNVVELPAVTEDGLGVTAVVVAWGGGLWTVKEDVPELVVCVESPE
jgi:hypothetical protein